MEGAGRLPLGARRVPVPGARPAQPAGSIQSPPQGMLGEAARIRAAGCACPSPSNRGLKWVKEEGGGPGGLGEGPEELRRHPEGGDQGKDAWKSKTMCAVGLGGPGQRSAEAAVHLGVLKITSELTVGGPSPWLLPLEGWSFSFSHPWLWGLHFPQHLSLFQSPTPNSPQPRVCEELSVSCGPLAQTWRWAQARRCGPRRVGRNHLADPIRGPSSAELWQCQAKSGPRHQGEETPGVSLGNLV